MNWYQKSQLELLYNPTPFYNDGLNISLFRYISNRQQPNMSLKQKIIRDISYRIKDSNETEALKYVAELMSRHVSPGSILVPIPSSSGSSGSNYILCKLIAKITGSEVVDALGRTEKVAPLHQLRKIRGLERERTPEEHKMDLTFMFSDLFENRKVYLIDNVMTSGSTINAARVTLQLPEAIGLTFSKAVAI